MYIHVYEYRVQVHFYPITLDTIEISVLMRRLLCWSEQKEDGIEVVFLCTSPIDSINSSCRLL